jgi:hypothetical protein
VLQTSQPQYTASNAGYANLNEEIWQETDNVRVRNQLPIVKGTRHDFYITYRTSRFRISP